jgi:predicted nucleotidyltransferase
MTHWVQGVACRSRRARSAHVMIAEPKACTILPFTGTSNRCDQRIDTPSQVENDPSQSLPGSCGVAKWVYKGRERELRSDAMTRIDFGDATPPNQAVVAPHVSESTLTFHPNSFQDVSELVESYCRPDAMSLMLYGSYARGDQTDSSDIDVIQTIPRNPGSTNVGNLSISSYLLEQVRTFVESQSLFAWHLKSEGIILIDPGDQLKIILESHPGVDPVLTCGRVLRLTAVLDVSPDEYSEFYRGLDRISIYLVRTVTYALAIGSGTSTFSLRGACQSLDGTGSLFQLCLNMRLATSVANWEIFVERRNFLHQLLGSLESNPYQSLEVLAVRSSVTSPDLSAVAVRALDKHERQINYTSRAMPVL